MNRMFFKMAVSLFGFVVFIGLVMGSTILYASTKGAGKRGVRSMQPVVVVDLSIKDFHTEPFKEMASRDDTCREVKNDLYLIDQKMVFWAWAGHCSDYSYGYVLFGRTPGEELMKLHDSIGGPRLESSAKASQGHRAMFDAMVENHKAEDLGLDESHTVIHFYSRRFRDV
jgi:hypothetical protein